MGLNERPIVGITLGDPSGIGSEIIVKSLAWENVYRWCRPLVIGDGNIIQQAMEFCGVKLKINKISSSGDAFFSQGIIDLIDLSNVELNDFKYGKVSAKGGKTSFEYIEKAIKMVLNHEIDTLVTGPINKESLAHAKINYIGHTEILAQLVGLESEPLTMFEVENLRVFFLSRHLSLIEACRFVNKKHLEEFILRASNYLDRLGIFEGPLAVAGLNPHCGENGLIGGEEKEIIKPVIDSMKSKGHNIIGPISADSIFFLAMKNNYRAVISLYHDQGHIACKTYDYLRTVSITLGLPFLRTSVDHGTAFELAGTGEANHLNMTEAIKAASKYCYYKA